MQELQIDNSLEHVAWDDACMACRKQFFWLCFDVSSLPFAMRTLIGYDKAVARRCWIGEFRLLCADAGVVCPGATLEAVTNAACCHLSRPLGYQGLL